MLDVSIRLEVLDLLDELRSQFELAVLYVTHDIASARYFADDTLVMYAGEIVERGPSEDVTQRPAHPYTQLLVASAPDPDRLGEPARAPRPPVRRGAREARCRARWAAALRRAAVSPTIAAAPSHRRCCGSTRSGRRPAGGSTWPHQTCSSKASRTGRRPSRPDRATCEPPDAALAKVTAPDVRITRRMHRMRALEPAHLCAS